MFNDKNPKMWYEKVDHKKTTQPIPEELLIELKNEAKKCYEADVANYNIKNSRTNSDFTWMKTIMSKGAVSDKIAANIVSVQNSPIHSIDILSNLIGMVKVGKKKECIIVLENLVDLFLDNLLPPNRKLMPFCERPLTLLNELSSGNAITRKKYLTLWYFENQLKEMYSAFVLALNTVAQDTVDSNKEKAITAMYKLLAGNAEQEKNLLAYIVNKLGDPSKKVASKTIYCLTRLLQQHSNMQGVVLTEIEKMLFRPNISLKAQYYGLCFLSQFYLCHETAEIARRLIEVYFSFFKACVKKGEVNSRMMSALLMGVNRAYPYAKLEMEKISDHINTLYRVVHFANFNVSLHALALLYQVSDHSNSVSDRFYSALYKKLLDPQIAATTHQAMLLSLVYKALVRDAQVNRIKIFVKRLLQIALYTQSSMACGILYLVSQILRKNQELSVLVLKPAAFSTPEEDGVEDDEEEKYMDVKEENDDEEKGNLEEEDSESLQINKSIEVSTPDAKTAPGWLHGVNVAKTEVHKDLNKYSGLCRNPLYGGGQFCSYTELINLKYHHHPTVSLFADNILNEKPVEYTGDPLKDFSLIRFLDRFVFKNPKQLKDVSKQGYHRTFGKRKNYIPRGVRALPVSSSSYLNEKQQKIPVEEVFLHTFLQKRFREKQKAAEDDESDLESVGSEEFESMLDKMTGMGKDLNEEELDYMDAVGDNLKFSRKNKSEDASDAENENEDDEEYGNENETEENVDQDLTEEDRELMQLSDGDDDDASDIVFDDSEDDAETSPKKKKKKDEDIASLFASAEEFASLLEDEGSSNVAPGSSNTWSNKDNAHVRQIAWEEKRNRWLKGRNDRSRKQGKQFTSNRKRKLPNKNNFQSKKSKNL